MMSFICLKFIRDSLMSMVDLITRLFVKVMMTVIPVLFMIVVVTVSVRDCAEFKNKLMGVMVYF
jgi:hypothetical protein